MTLPFSYVTDHPRKLHRHVIFRMAWAFWAAPIEEVFESAADMMELNRMVDAIEDSKGVKFAQGFNPEVDCIRLAFDPVVASHRPLIYYIVSAVSPRNAHA